MLKGTLEEREISVTWNVKSKQNERVKKERQEKKRRKVRGKNGGKVKTRGELEDAEK